MLSYILFNLFTTKYRTASIASLFFVLINVFLYLLFFIDLQQIAGDGTYGSDASYYWQAIQNVYNGNNSFMEFDAPLFVLWGKIILLSTFYPLHFWIVLNNILLVSTSVLLLCKMLIRNLDSNKFNIQNTILVFSVLSLNPTISWMIIRGLKEPLIIFNISLFVYTLEALTSKCFSNARVLISFSAFFLIFYCLDGLRPFGGLLILPYFILRIWFYIYQSGKLLRNIYKIAGIIGFAFIFPTLLMRFSFITKFQDAFGEQSLSSGPEILQNSANSIGILTFPLSVIRFIFGPGPVRSFQQIVSGNIFEVSTPLGDVLIFLGSTEWWIVIGMVSLLIFKNLKQNTYLILKFAPFLSIPLVTISIYSYIYFGTGDTRHRAFLYFFLNAVFAFIFSRRKVLQKL